jgi:hypothetical protein
MIGGVPLVLAADGQCLASHGCHAYGGWLGGAIVGGGVLVTFIVIAVRLWRKPGTSQSQYVGVDSLARSGSAGRVGQIIEGLQSGQTTVVVSSSDGASNPVSGEATVQRRAKLAELHRIGALTDEEFARQMALLKPEP